MEVDGDQEDSEAQERDCHLEERWKCGQDDAPASGPQGPDEQDRVLVGGYQTKYVVACPLYQIANPQSTCRIRK